MLSGYRVFSRRFVKSFPALARGFEIKTELTIHALLLRLPIAQIPTPYRERPSESPSKLRTIDDGARILHVIVTLIKQEKPLRFFGVWLLPWPAWSIALAFPVLEIYMVNGTRTALAHGRA